MPRSWLFDEYGDANVLRIADMQQSSQLQSHQIRIKTAVIGINHADLDYRSGKHPLCATNTNFPKTLGFDISGTVIEAAEDSLFKEGDRVCGCAGYPNDPCAYSEEVVVNDTYFALVPREVSMMQAAALPTAGVTALDITQCIGDGFNGDVLLTGSTGGVGHILTKLLALNGCNITSLCRRKNFVYAYEYGARECIDYNDDLKFYYQKFDTVVDVIGGEKGKSLFDFVKPGGLLVTIPTKSRDEIIDYASNFDRVTARGVFANIDKSKLDYLLDLMRKGQLKLNVKSVFSFDDAIRAHEKLSDNHTVGKIVLAL